ncbi:MAG: methyl-accepting chemotaxis protein [Euryarchaeota archaeon]|nr:methyl-accepting chemotaxis protein [Euryarchaeota archaeon]
MSINYINGILQSALDGDFSRKVDVTELPDDMKVIGENVNKAVRKLKNVDMHEQMLKGSDDFIKYNPQAIAVLGPDKSRLDLNPQYEKIWRGTRDELMAKKLYDFDIEVTGGDDLYASFVTKSNATTDMTISWARDEKTYVRLFQVPILNNDGEIDVVYYIYEDLTAQHNELAEVQKLQKRADAFLNQNPQGITALAADKHRLDLNEMYQKIWRGGYEELMAKKLYDFDIEITGGDDFYASYETKKNAITQMKINWPNGETSYLTLYQTPILDENGDIDVNYYIYQDQTPEKTLEKYLNQEVDTIVDNLALFAKGETRNFNLEVGAGDEYTELARENFLKISANLKKVQETFAAMTIDFVKTVNAQKAGKTDVRADPEKLSGVFAVLTKGMNDVLDAVITPVKEAMRLSDEYAKNNLSARFDESIDVQGDFITFKDALNNIGIEVGKTLAESKDALAMVDANMVDATKGIEEISKAMEQVAVNSQQSAEDSKKQIDVVEVVAREISDLSASIEEIASTSQTVVDNTTEVTKSGDEASKLGNEASDKMQAVEKISEQSVTEINALNEKMHEINNIVKLITDISNQTNLLALNAAIEAARAGEHGRGFAVVAGEVKNLAGESKAATNNIEKLISGIQADSVRTAESMKSAYDEIKVGIESVEKTINSLNFMVQSSRDAAEGVGEIARATDDQANATNRVMQEMENVTTITTENMRRIDDMAALTEEVAASTEEVGSGAHEVGAMSKRLREMMDVFKTE